MGKHFNLNRGDTFIEPVPDALMELLGAAVPSLNVTILNSTTLQVTADADNGQQAVSINSRWRWRQTSTTAAHPGGGAGSHSVYVTASDNAITPGSLLSASVDTTDYTFGLQILTSGTPGTALYRKVGEVEWNGSAITGFRHMVGPRREDAPITPTAPIPEVIPVKVKGAASQTGYLIRFENSASTLLVAVDSAGKLLFNTDVNLYRESADVLATDDKLHVVGELEVDGALNHDGTTVGFYGVAPTARPAAMSNATGLSADDSLAADASLDEVIKWALAINQRLAAVGLFG